MSAALQDLKHRIVEAGYSVTWGKLVRVGQEINYRFDICRATHGARTEYIGLEGPKNFERSSIQ